jgi:hypothetical protein
MLLEFVVGVCQCFRMACRSHVEGEAVYEYFNLLNMQENEHLPRNATQN